LKGGEAAGAGMFVELSFCIDSGALELERSSCSSTCHEGRLWKLHESGSGHGQSEAAVLVILLWISCCRLVLVCNLLLLLLLLLDHDVLAGDELEMELLKLSVAA
jgi:hypothetical protein